MSVIHFSSSDDTFWNAADWDYWETRQDRRCANCKMHSGFEHSATQAASRNLKSMAQMASWYVSG